MIERPSVSGSAAAVGPAATAGSGDSSHLTPDLPQAPSWKYHKWFSRTPNAHTPQIVPLLSQVQQRLLDPLQQLAADRCHLTRDTGAVIQGCGHFSRVDAMAPFVVPGAGLIGPHAAGIAYV